MRTSTRCTRRTRAEGFGAEVKRRILVGTYVLSHGYYDAYYLKAQQVRRLIAQDFVRAYAQCDVIAGPTTPTAAFAIGAKADDPVEMYLNDIFTVAANLTGMPAMSIPCGFTPAGLPVGLQLQGNYFAEARLLERRASLPAGDRLAPTRAAGGRRRPNDRGIGALTDGLGSRHRSRDAHAAVDGVEDFFRRVDDVRCAAQHAGVGRGHRAAGRAAGAQSRGRRAGDPLRPGRRRRDQPPQRVRAQELLLSRPAEGLPDLAIRNSRREGRRADDRHRQRRENDPADARASRGGRRQVAARGIAGDGGRRFRHRPQSRRHAAARNRVGARPAQLGRSRCVCEEAPRARDVDRHLRRQHAGGKLPLRRERLGAPRRRAARHALRDQEPEQLPLHAAGDRLRGAPADRADRRRRHRRPGNAAVRRRPQRDAADARQGRRAGLPLFPRSRPAAARHRRRVDRARAKRDARAARGDACAARRRARHRRLRRRAADVVA